jgi:hypothetical protein
VEAQAPGIRVTVAVAFAEIGAMPAKNRDGNTMNMPPPAKAFMAPPSRAAARRIAQVIGEWGKKFNRSRRA